MLPPQLLWQVVRHNLPGESYWPAKNRGAGGDPMPNHENICVFLRYHGARRAVAQDALLQMNGVGRAVTQPRIVSTRVPTNAGNARLLAESGAACETANSCHGFK